MKRCLIQLVVIALILGVVRANPTMVFVFAALAVLASCAAYLRDRPRGLHPRPGSD
jgi:hypothetical protein